MSLKTFPRVANATLFLFSKSYTLISKASFAILILAAISLLPQPGKAQQPSYKKISVRDGLPSSEIYDIFQDSRGFIWFASDAGAAVFNGTTYKTYTTADGLTDNTVFGFYEDHKNRIWIRTMSGGLVYFKNDSIVRLPFNDQIIQSLKGWSFITSLFVTKDDVLWLGYNQPCYSFADLKDRDAKLTTTKSSTYLISDQENGYIWGGMINKNNDQLHFQKGNTKSVIKFPGQISDSIKKNYTTCINVFGDSTYIHQANKLHLIYSGKIINTLSFEHDISFIFRDKTNNLWIGLFGQGVLKLKDGTGKDKEHFFKDLHINDILEDHEGGMWLSTLTSGVYYLPNYKITTILPDASGNNRVNKITEAGSGKLMIGMNSGKIYSYDLQTSTLKFEEDPKLGPHKTFMNTSDKLWVGCSNGFYSINHRSGKRSGKTIFNARAIEKESDTTLLVGKISGLSKAYINRSVIIPEDIGTGKAATQCIVPYKNGSFLIGTNEGLKLYRNSTITNFSDHPQLTLRIECICISKDSLLWLGTRGSGVFIFDPATSRIDTLNVKKGLASNFIRAIVKDDAGTIWIATGKGISKVNKHNGKTQIQNITTSDGLVSDEINTICIVNQHLYAGTPEGISSFNINDVRSNLVPPRIYVTDLKINGRDTVIGSLILSHDQNFIEIMFTGLSFNTEDRKYFKYKMSGIDKDWVFTERSRVQYTTIPPGKYKFSVLAMNNSGVWSSHPYTIDIVITKPFWKEWWFILSCILSFSLIVIVLIRQQYQRKIRIHRERIEYERRIIESELRSLRAQINPHFIFNSLNSIQRFILENDPLSANNYLSKFSRLIRNVLQNSRHDLITLEEEITTLRVYLELESLRCNNGFHFTISTCESIDRHRTRIPGMMIQPFVENSIWHGLMPRGGNGSILIHFKKENDSIICTVEDNGVGREHGAVSKRNGKSLGIKVTGERLETIRERYKRKADFIITDLYSGSQPAGTRVLVTLPDIQLT